ncbi:MAG TPA: pilus assembly protein N-terminal domain-containing protein [Aestuariivirga sp.]
MRISLSVLLTSASLVTSNFIGFANAGTPLTVLVDRSQLMMLSADPGTVVVGNPSMADVSLNGRQLFINGHSAGETNLLVFDQSGEKIADYDITIMQVGENSLTVFKGTVAGTQKYSFACAPICERAIMPGDESAPLELLLGDNQGKYGFSQGIKPGDKSAAGAPSAAQ